jgi:hypothetical protein
MGASPWLMAAGTADHTPVSFVRRSDRVDGLACLKAPFGQGRISRLYRRVTHHRRESRGCGRRGSRSERKALPHSHIRLCTECFKECSSTVSDSLRARSRRKSCAKASSRSLAVCQRSSGTPRTGHSAVGRADSPSTNVSGSSMARGKAAMATCRARCTDLRAAFLAALFRGGALLLAPASALRGGTFGPAVFLTDAAGPTPFVSFLSSARPSDGRALTFVFFARATAFLNALLAA